MSPCTLSLKQIDTFTSNTNNDFGVFFGVFLCFTFAHFLHILCWNSFFSITPLNRDTNAWGTARESFNVTASGGHGGADRIQRCHQLEEWRLMSGHEQRAARVTSGFCPALTLSSGKEFICLPPRSYTFKLSHYGDRAKLLGFFCISMPTVQHVVHKRIHSQLTGYTLGLEFTQETSFGHHMSKPRERAWR